MGRRSRFLVAGVVAAWAGVACGDDPPTKPSGSAGAAGSGDTAGQPNENEAGSSNLPGGGDASTAGTAGTGEAGAQSLGGASGGGDGEGGAAGDSDEDPTDVHGVLKGYEFPIADAVILVDDVVTTTDAQGRFTVKHVAEHYRLVAAVPAFKTALVYEDVSTRTPLPQFASVFSEPVYPYEASVRGKVTGPGGGALTDEWTSVFWFTPGQRQLASQIVVPPESFDRQPSWIGSPKLDVELWAMQDTVDGDVLGFGRRSMVLEDGKLYGSVNGSAQTDLELADVTEQDVDVKITLAAGWTIDAAPLRVGPFGYPTGITTAGDHQVVVPDLDLPILLDIKVAGNDGSTGNLALSPPASGAWEISVPGLPQHISPGDNADAVTKDTVFSFTKPTGFVTNIGFLVEDWTIFLATNKTQTKVPDLTGLGVQFEGVLTGTWHLFSIGPADTVDDQMLIEQEIYSEAFHSAPYGQLTRVAPLNFAAPL